MLSVSNLSKGYPATDMYPVHATWDEIPNIITNHVWGNILWAGRYRKEIYFLGSYYCVLDIDDGLTKKEVCEKLQGFKYILGPTKSDGIVKSGKPACDRFRVIIPWDNPIERYDIYRFNMIKLINEFQSDVQTSDGARPWQKCKNIEIMKSHGKSIVVDRDLPEEATEAYRNKQMQKAKSAMRRNAPLPAKVQDFLQGLAPKGFTNSLLFLTACQLFNRGFTIEEAHDFLEVVPGGVTLRKDYKTTFLSAARSTGAM